MENNSPNQSFLRMKRVQQITSSHCAPAVLQMLLSFWSLDIDQAQITQAAGAQDKIYDYGVIYPELALAVERLAPDLTFWYKKNASLNDLVKLIKVYEVPVGVEWQGVFEEDEDDDNGHYGVVTDVDLRNNVILISDPYGKYAGKDRSFTIDFFQRRWWETSEVRNPQTGKTYILKDYQLLFTVLPSFMTYPIDIGMVKRSNG
jgi:ABC-type bacteriocin/lantibiotic exporter with double-glycine peptidase domain